MPHKPWKLLLSFWTTSLALAIAIIIVTLFTLATFLSCYWKKYIERPNELVTASKSTFYPAVERRQTQAVLGCELRQKSSDENSRFGKHVWRRGHSP